MCCIKILRLYADEISGICYSMKTLINSAVSHKNSLLTRSKEKPLISTIADKIAASVQIMKPHEVIRCEEKKN